MKVDYWIGTILVLAVLLTGCKNRFETYEPYSSYDDRMAAYEKGDAYAPEQAYGDQFATASDNGYVERNQAAAPRSRPQGFDPASSAAAEVPFDSSRGTKHPVNIGAY